MTKGPLKNRPCGKPSGGDPGTLCPRHAALMDAVPPNAYGAREYEVTFSDGVATDSTGAQFRELHPRIRAVLSSENMGLV
jgi:hypothetical protein